MQEYEEAHLELSTRPEMGVCRLYVRIELSGSVPPLQRPADHGPRTVDRVDRGPCPPARLRGRCLGTLTVWMVFEDGLEAKKEGKRKEKQRKQESDGSGRAGTRCVIRIQGHLTPWQLARCGVKPPGEIGRDALLLCLSSHPSMHVPARKPPPESVGQG